MTLIAELLTAMANNATIATDQRMGRMLRLPITDVRGRALLMTFIAVVWRPVVAETAVPCLSHFSVDSQPLFTGVCIWSIFLSVTFNALVGRLVTVMTLFQARFHLWPVEASAVQRMYEILMTNDTIKAENFYVCPDSFRRSWTIVSPPPHTRIGQWLSAGRSHCSRS